MPLKKALLSQILYLVIFGKFVIAAFLQIKISIKLGEHRFIHNRILFYFKITPGDALSFFGRQFLWF